MARPRIARLQIATAIPLTVLASFYGDLLGLKCNVTENGILEIVVGASTLAIESDERSGDSPCYHFALNVPENQALDAYRWLNERVELIPIPVTLQDADMPTEFAHFRSWNAHALYFFDPAGNVVELIARHSLPNATDAPFGSQSLLCVSEIAFGVEDVSHWSSEMQERYCLEPYRESGPEFTGMGDEEGLLLLMKVGRKFSFASVEEKYVGVHPTSVWLRDLPGDSYSPEGSPYRILRAS